MEKSFAEILVAAHYQAALKSTYSKTGAEECALAKSAIIQALTVPAPEDDFPTVRDQFAMAAMQGRRASDNSADSDDSEAHICYQIADAMMRARKEVTP